MKRRWIFSSVFLLIALTAGYLTLLSWQAGDSGRWLFGVFGIFFAVLAITPHLKAPPPAAAPTSTRFTPHWFLLAAAAVTVLIVVTALARAILQY